MKKDRVELDRVKLAAELAVHHGVVPERIHIIGISDDLWQFIDYVVLPGEPTEASIAAEKRIALEWERTFLGWDDVLAQIRSK